MKSKLTSLIVLFIFIVALCTAIFNLGEYDFFSRLAMASQLEFNNPINTFIRVGEQVKDISNWGDLKIQWFEYIPRFFNWLGSIFSSVFDGIVETAKTLLNGIKFVLIMLGFNL